MSVIRKHVRTNACYVFLTETEATKHVRFHVVAPVFGPYTEQPTHRHHKKHTASYYSICNAREDLERCLSACAMVQAHCVPRLNREDLDRCLSACAMVQTHLMKTHLMIPASWSILLASRTLPRILAWPHSSGNDNLAVAPKPFSCLPQIQG